MSDRGKVALYLRVSSEEQVERATIETQESFLADYCKLYGIDVVDTYKDAGLSGTVPMHERPEGARLLGDLENLDSVLVYRLDRIGRTLTNVVEAHERLESAGVAMLSATEPIDTSTPSGRLIFHMLASFAEFERGTIAERTKHGLHRAFRAGRHTGKIPYGYDVTDEGFVIVEDEAQVVREMISNIARGSTLYGESQRLNSMAIPGPGHRYRGKERKHSASWTPSTISRIVNRGAYSGIHTVEADTGAIERECPPIVPAELQERALWQLKQNRRFSSAESNRKYLLAGLIVCDVCGANFVSHPSAAYGKRRHYYVCNADRPLNRKGQSHAPYVRAEWIESVVWADVRKFLADPGEALERLRNSGSEGAEDHAARLSELSERIRGVQAEKDRYVKLYASEHLNDAELETHIADANARLSHLRLLHESAEAKLSEQREEKERLEGTASWLASLSERLLEIEEETEEAFAKRREIVNLLVERVMVGGRSPDGEISLNISYRFG